MRDFILSTAILAIVGFCGFEVITKLNSELRNKDKQMRQYALETVELHQALSVAKALSNNQDAETHDDDESICLMAEKFQDKWPNSELLYGFEGLDYCW